ncbi:hypothetical protein [Actinophytocola gossypii]|uniref:Lipoprotein n=1 Tax=Actinophytocola gossypii TaxID=2812003 RepID=A0ABT2J889_9PSEU|nr:hypothetical protein [Actinophytocola gossypii]MCT2584075.1 hypothetical protein [Actinophytocola gossypii]
MRSRPGRATLAGLLVGLVLLVTGCTSTVAGTPDGVDIGPLTTEAGTAQALLDFTEVGAVHYTGSLVAADGAAFTVDVHALATGAVFGRISVNGMSAAVTVIDDVLYLKGDGRFWNGMAARFGVAGGNGEAFADRWVKLPTSLIGVEFGEVFAPDVISRTAGPVVESDARSELSANPRESVAGTEVYVVQVDGGKIYLAAEAPHGPLRFELDRIGSADTTAVTDVVLDVADASPSAPTIYRDLAKRARTELTTAVDALVGIEQGEHRFEACGAPSCTLRVDIRNTGKSAVRVHLKADWTGDSAPLGSCEAKVGPVAPGAASTIGCKITTQAWVDFYQRANSVPGTHPYGAQWSALVLAEPPKATELTAAARAEPATADPARTEGSHAVYQIVHAGTVWKYGVVSQQFWRDHTDGQLPGCLTQTESACSASLVTAADGSASAHALLTQLVADYRDENGECPAGQWVACVPA